MSAAAQPRSGPILAVGSFVVVVGVLVVGVVLVQQALVARSPSGYQVAILDLARQIGLAPPQPTFADPGPGPARYGFVGVGGFGGQLGVAAQTIGIPMDQLRTELAAASLTQVARAHGVDADAVATAMKSASDSQVDAAVADGRLAADQAAQRKAEAEQRIDQLMTQVAPGVIRKGPPAL
ncbi:MAG: hypothetical protein JOZ87_19555 [Chloroflexi bacterium]|nr:hypothetical protein [Chloroflexota bacterium]